MHKSEGLVWYRFVVDVLSAAARLVVFVRRAVIVQLLQERDVIDAARAQAFFVQHRQDAGATLRRRQANNVVSGLLAYSLHCHIASTKLDQITIWGLTHVNAK